MINFTYSMPTEIVFGKQQITALPDLLKKHQVKKLLLVYGEGSIKRIGLYAQLMSILDACDIEVYEENGVRPNPELTSVKQGRTQIITHNIDFVLAVGGGSVIDAAKAMCYSPYVDEKELWNAYMGEYKIVQALPLGTILTLAATGTETNGNTVLTNDAINDKRSFASPYLVPKFSIIDPSYTLHVNKHYTVAGCIDIMMHVFEQYFSNTERTETSDYMSVGILKSVIENTERYLAGDDDYETRANISWAATNALSWLLAQGKVGDWATHRLSYPLTSEFGTTHGYALTSIYYAWMETALKYNEATMKRRLAFLSKELFGGVSYEKVPKLIKDLFASWGAPTQLDNVGDATLKNMAKAATSQKPIGTVIKIDQDKAEEIFRLARATA